MPHSRARYGPSAWRSFSFADNRLGLLPSWRATDASGDDSRGARALFPRRVSAILLSREWPYDRSGVAARLPGAAGFPPALGAARRDNFGSDHDGASGLFD